MAKSAAPRMTKKAEKLLLKIKAHILEEPRRLAMGIIERHGAPGAKVYVGRDEFNARNPYEAQQVFPECGTMACIMGWAKIFNGGIEPRHEFIGDLCSAADWPKEFRIRYSRAKTPLGRARAAADCIDDYIRTHRGRA